MKMGMKLKTTICFTLICFFTLQAQTTDKPEYTSQPDSSLIKIAHNSEIMAKNTFPTKLTQTDQDDWWIIAITTFSLIVSMAAAYWAWIAAKATSKTVRAIEQETEELKKRQINQKFQKKILSDLLRHLYRNKICISAIRLKLGSKENGYNHYYPSEEHLLKLRVLPEDLRLDRFDNTPDYYDELHKIELYFRNFNIEVEVTLEHLKTMTLSDQIKRRDLDVLEMKTGFLTKEIFNLMNRMKNPITSDDVKELLTKESDNKKQNNQKNQEEIYIPERKSDNKNITYYDDVLCLTDQLNEDIRNEYPKISLISFT